MKVAHISDIHNEEGPRFNECAQVCDAFVEHCRREKVGLVTASGDFVHPVSVGTPASIQEELFLTGFFQRLAEDATVVGVRGNHDKLGDVEIYNRLEAKNPIWFTERPHTFTHRDFDCICLPWFDKTQLVATLPADMSAEETTRRTVAVAQQLLLTMRGQVERTRAAGRIPIGIAHPMVYGSEVSTGQRIMGMTVELSPFDLSEVGCAYFALGHVHKRQVWDDGRVAYAGSPMRHNLGESEAKGFNLVEIEKDGDGYKVRNDFVELPARRIELYEIDFTNEANLAQLKEHGLNVCTGIAVRDRTNDAMVRFRYHIRPEDRHLVDEKALEKVLQADGAFSVKIDPQLVHTARVRSEAIVKAETAWEKLVCYWNSKGMEIPEDVAVRLKEKLALIESGQLPETTGSKKVAAARVPSDGLFAEDTAEARV